MILINDKKSGSALFMKRQFVIYRHKKTAYLTSLLFELPILQCIF